MHSRQGVGGRAKQKAPGLSACPRLHRQRTVSVVATGIGHKPTWPVPQALVPNCTESWFEACGAGTGDGAAPCAAVVAAALRSPAAAPVRRPSLTRTMAAPGRRRVWRSACASPAVAAACSPVAVHAAPQEKFAGSGNSKLQGMQDKIKEAEDVLKKLRQKGAAVDSPAYTAMLQNLAALRVEMNTLMKASQAGGLAGLASVAEPLMQASWCKLLELRAAEGVASTTATGGEGRMFQVIKLGASLRFPGKGRVSQVLRYDCYGVARSRIKCIWAQPDTDRGRTVVITGTPGIGKTVFLYDLMYAYADGKHTIVWHGWDQDVVYCFGPAGDVRKGSVQAFAEELQDPNTLYLCDSVAPSRPGFFEPMTVIAIAPDRLKQHPYNDIVKTAHKMWFPVPSDEEMYAAAPLYGVDEPLCRELMGRWGNVPRYVLQQARNQLVQQELEDAIASCDVESLEDAAFDYSRSGPALEKILHKGVNSNLTKPYFGSMYIQTRVYERLAQLEGSTAARRMVELISGLHGVPFGAGGLHQGST